MPITPVWEISLTDDLVTNTENVNAIKDDGGKIQGGIL